MRKNLNEEYKHGVSHASIYFYELNIKVFAIGMDFEKI